MDKQKLLLIFAGLAMVASVPFAFALPGIMDSAREIETAKKKDAYSERVVASVEKVADAAAHRLYREHVQLPVNEKGKYWLTLLFPDNWESDPESRRLHSFFCDEGGDRRLIEMRTTTCRLNNYTMMEAKARDSWTQYASKNAPFVLLQEPDGRPVFKASAGNIPDTSNELVERIQAAVSASRPAQINGDAVKPEVKPQPDQPQFIHRRDRRRSDTGEPKLVATLASYTTYSERGCRPKPAPEVPTPATPDFVTPIQPIPDTVENVEQQPADNSDPLWLLGLLAAIGVPAGALYSRRHK